MLSIDWPSSGSTVRAPVIGRLALTCATTPASVDGPLRTVVRGEQGDGLLVGGAIGAAGAAWTQAGTTSRQATAAAGEPHPVKPVGVLGVRGLRGATRLAAAAHALERSFSVLAGVASVKVTRALTVRIPLPSLTTRLERRPGAGRDDVRCRPRRRRGGSSAPVTTARKERSTQRVMP